MKLSNLHLRMIFFVTLIFISIFGLWGIGFGADFGTQTPSTEYVTVNDYPKISVNTVNLNLMVQATDLSYSLRGPKVEITRTYNSGDSQGLWTPVIGQPETGNKL
jgi:hypothetical protein